MLYRTTKCPYCGYKLEDRVVYAKSLIGPPLSTCPACQKIFKTGMKYWASMSIMEKFWYIIRAIWLFPFTVGMYTVFILLIPGITIGVLMETNVINGKTIEKYGIIGIWIVGIIFLCLSILYIYTIIKEISSFPHDENCDK